MAAMKSTQKPRVKPKRLQSKPGKRPESPDKAAVDEFEREGMGVAPKE